MLVDRNKKIKPAKMIKLTKKLRKKSMPIY